MVAHHDSPSVFARTGGPRRDVAHVVHRQRQTFAPCAPRAKHRPEVSRVKLRDIAHARSGDKGDTATIALIAYRQSDFEWLRQAVTAERVVRYLGIEAHRNLARYELPSLGALTFVIPAALGGGVTCSLALDPHGKCLASLLLGMDVGERP